MQSIRTCAALGLCLAAAVVAYDQEREGFKDTAILPGQKWHVHDSDRPYPPVVTLGKSPGDPPSDAVVLFDGKDLSKWQSKGGPARWKMGNGYFEVAAGTGDLQSRDKFGDCQLHIEWEEPTDIHGVGQDRGNSGVYLMSRYEVQVLDSYQHATYADGQAGAMYGQWPPLVNPIRKPGEWNVYDIMFEAPRFEGGKLAKPAYQTVLFNGVLVHLHQPIVGATVYRRVAQYSPHADEEPLQLQDHGHPVRFRNVWVRRLMGYDRQ
jgi:hypothetical protein